MGQKVNPVSNRLGIVRGWDSNWYDVKKLADNILEDSKLRKYLNVRLAKCSVSRIVIERTLKLITITVCTSRPGLIIGKGGQEVDKLKEELKKITDKDVQINIFRGEASGSRRSDRGKHDSSPDRGQDRLPSCREDGYRRYDAQRCRGHQGADQRPSERC